MSEVAEEVVTTPDDVQGEMIDEGQTPEPSEDTLAERKLQAELEEERGEPQLDTTVPQERDRNPLVPSAVLEAGGSEADRKLAASMSMTRDELDRVATELGLDPAEYASKRLIIAAIDKAEASA